MGKSNAASYVPDITWEMILDATSGAGTSWFRDPGEPRKNDVTAPEAAKGFGFKLGNSEFNKSLQYSKYFSHAKEKNGKVYPGWSTKQSYVKSKPLSASRLIPRIERALKDIGIIVTRTGQSSNDEEIAGFWSNEYSLPFIQYGQIFETKDGTEYLSWCTDIFLNSKKLSEQQADSWGLKIPALIEAMMFLAESPLNQSSISLSRSTSSIFEGVSAERIPHPAIAFAEGGAAMVVSQQKKGKLKAEYFPSPTTISACYDVCESLSDSELRTVMETLSNAFVSLSTQSVTAYDAANHVSDTGLMDLWEATGISTWTKLPDGSEGNVVGDKGILMAACFNWQSLEKFF